MSETLPIPLEDEPLNKSTNIIARMNSFLANNSFLSNAKEVAAIGIKLFQTYPYFIHCDY